MKCWSRGRSREGDHRVPRRPRHLGQRRTGVAGKAGRAIPFQHIVHATHRGSGGDRPSGKLRQTAADRSAVNPQAIGQGVRCHEDVISGLRGQRRARAPSAASTTIMGLNDRTIWNRSRTRYQSRTGSAIVAVTSGKPLQCGVPPRPPPFAAIRKAQHFRACWTAFGAVLPSKAPPVVQSTTLLALVNCHEP